MVDYLFYILFIIILYFSASIIEWYWHKNILHSKTPFNNKYLETQRTIHINHHKYTEHDMSINNKDDKALFFDIYNYIIFNIIGIVILIPYLFIINILNNISYYNIIVYCIIILIFSLLYIYLFNNMHRISHKDKNKDNWLYNISYYKWFEFNHTMHHLRRGDDRKSNYNFNFPFADYFFNTFNEKADNKEHCKNNEDKELICNPNCEDISEIYDKILCS